jgi:hypothetical protein
MCDDHANPLAPRRPGAERPATTRRRLWEVEGGLHCSIIGTCASHDDLVRIAGKLGLKLPRDATDHKVHSTFVQVAHIPGPVSRAVQKLLESRYATIARKVRATSDPAALDALWTHERDEGRVAGAYWAFLTHDHVPEPLRVRIFGEVHMLSHLLGRTASRQAALVSELTARVDDLEARIARQNDRHQAVVAERDAARVQLEQISRKVAGAGPVARPSRQRRRPEVASNAQRHARALLAARTRARTAEAAGERLQHEVRRLRALLSEATAIATPPPCPAAAACDAAVRDDIARRVLYLGGRSGTVDTLRRVAAERRAELIHHDGGEEMSVKRIDGLVEHCDVVFCPVDCISHQACLKAKALCRKHGKPFVPLRSSGAASFERALSALPVRH